MDFSELLEKASSIAGNYVTREPYQIVTETKNWAITEDANSISRSLKRKGISNRVTRMHHGLKGRVLHFMSPNTLFNMQGPKNIDPSNKIILNWYHVEKADHRLSNVEFINNYVDAVFTSCSLTKKELINAGVKDTLIHLAPVPLEIEYFSSDKIASCSNQPKLKEFQGKFVVGSFQKDGEGWGEGEHPKLIKGPDIFCDTMELLAKEVDLHVLLTGPSRGYVKKRLSKAGISYSHYYLDKYSDIVKYYCQLDAYLIASRKEGGPKALLESWACGVPVVSTPVGQVVDLGKNEENVHLSNDFSAKSLAEGLVKIASQENYRQDLIANGKKAVAAYTWENIFEQCFYPILKKSL